MTKTAKDTFLDATLVLISSFIVIYFITTVKDQLIPFVIALVLWYLTIAAANKIQKTPLRTFNCSESIALLIAILFGVGIFCLLLYMLSKNIYNVIYAIPKYQENLNKILDHTLQRFHLHSASLTSSLSFIQKNDFLPWLSTAAQTLTEIISLTGIILIYYIFMLFEYKSFDSKLKALFKEKSKLKTAQTIVHTINAKLQSYLWLKTLLSLSTAGFAYILLLCV